MPKKENTYPAGFNLQQFALTPFDPDKVLMANAKTGSIPKETANLVVTDFVNHSVVAQLGKYEEMTTMEKDFTYLASGPGAYWVDEGDRIQTDKATWLTANMKAKKLGVIIPVTKEFLNYTVTDFFTQMRPAIAEAFYTAFDKAVIFGTNSPYGSGKSIMEKINTEDNKIAIGSNDTLYLDLNDVMALIEDADGDPSGFLTIKKFRKDLRGTVDNNGLPIFNSPGNGAADMALGLPIGYADIKAWDASKNVAALAGDWEFLRYGILQDMEFAISNDATLTTLEDGNGEAVNLFERDMFALRVTMHIGAMILKDDAFAALMAASAVVRHRINTAKAGGTVDIITSPDTRASKDALVTVEIDNIEANKEFKTIAVAGPAGSVSTTTVSAGEKYTFIMPDGDVTITVTVGAP